ncbi:probable arsenite efflux transporter ArsB-like, puative [Phialocephala subalpina]|uniref:Probable arsenite efflux transporter ArsB-like, puative n=1 Tax=Phialocephala subalpina TaxID=576137 RepID=A0A1L7X1J0_9HELO|nr:probable arsenite efflux transporter ArsB-like, puative [Phialocephala subalpina]
MTDDIDVDVDVDTGQIGNWRSIVTLIVFILANIIVLFPFHVPIYVPRPLSNAILDVLSALRVISPRQARSQNVSKDDQDEKVKPFVKLNFPLNFVTAPLIADLFLLAILAIGRKEVHDGTIGANHISPIDIMVFFLTLAYIAISIDASGLIRYLAFKVLQKGGEVGHRLFFYLYVFFFGLGSFIGNDPIILSGTAFLAYMTRVSSNIIHPRAWIHTQFAIANIASAILVSSNPTNLVLAGAFNIKFIEYTANMIVPVVVTAILLFPFLLYIVFADPSLIPYSIKMHELSPEARARAPVNPNIPHARGVAAEEEKMLADNEQGRLLSLEEIMNPFLDKGGAAFGAVIMTATLVTVLALNAASQSKGEHPVFWVTLPAAFVMFCFDMGSGWVNRHETRRIALKGRQELEQARVDRANRTEEGEEMQDTASGPKTLTETQQRDTTTKTDAEIMPADSIAGPSQERSGTTSSRETDEEKQNSSEVQATLGQTRGQPTLASLVKDAYRWSQETFPTVTTVAAHLPFALLPFAFAMFVLVQALVTKGWVNVFAYGWDHWVNNTGTVGAIAGMGFISVILCNFAGTNIGTTILLSRVIQAWQQIHHNNPIPITNRTFWATVYSMALGVNYGAFSTAFSASLAGLLWRDILSKKHIHVKRLEFARVNLPIIAIAMAVGCTILVGEVYIIRNNDAYNKP